MTVVISLQQVKGATSGKCRNRISALAYEETTRDSGTSLHAIMSAALPREAAPIECTFAFVLFADRPRDTLTNNHVSIRHCRRVSRAGARRLDFRRARRRADRYGIHSPRTASPSAWLRARRTAKNRTRQRRSAFRRAPRPDNWGANRIAY